MNVIIPLTNLGFLDGFYYPTCMQVVGGRTVLEHSISSLNISGQYRFIIRWDDHTKYSLGNYIEKAFPGSIVHITKERYINGDADALLQLPSLSGPMIVFDGRSQILFNSTSLLNRVSQAKADSVIAVYANYNRKLPHVRIGGYDKNLVSRVLFDKSNFACAGLYYFNESKHYFNMAPSIIRDELEMEYRPIEIWDILNYMIDNGARTIYHRCARKSLDSVDQLARFEGNAPKN